MKHIITCLIFLGGLSTSAYSQSELKINCFTSTNSPDVYYNAFYIDDQMIEYATCGLDQAFYVGVIDPATCSAWATNFNGSNPAHDFGNLNNDGYCRQRPESYFVFRQSDSMELEGMKNMIQQIPDGHSFFIYTPISYSYTAVNAVNPALIQELESRWLPSVIQGEDIMVLYGIQGNAQSFVSETNQTNGQISFTTAVCGSLGLSELQSEYRLFIKQEGTKLTINPDLAVDDFRILDAAGKAISFVRTENIIELPVGIAPGVYIFQASAAGKTLHSKQLIGY